MFDWSAVSDSYAGVSATSIIRQFNSSTPIISMTSNSQPDDILTYFSHGAFALWRALLALTSSTLRTGMTDVLPKPFTKEALRNMLEVGTRSSICSSLRSLTDHRNISSTSRKSSNSSKSPGPSAFPNRKSPTPSLPLSHPLTSNRKPCSVRNRSILSPRWVSPMKTLLRSYCRP